MLHVSCPRTQACISYMNELKQLSWTDLVGRKSLGDQRDLEACKQSLYSHGVLQYCSSSLRFSPAKIHGGYAVLTQMADLLRYSNINTCRVLLLFQCQSLKACFCPTSTCCVGLGAFRDMDVFSHDFLPSVVESLLFLADRLMNRALRVRYNSLLNHRKHQVARFGLFILKSASY